MRWTEEEARGNPRVREALDAEELRRATGTLSSSAVLKKLRDADLVAEPPKCRPPAPAVAGAPDIEARVDPPERTFASQLEADRAEYLELLRKAGEIAWWDHECMRLRIGHRAWYKPDFFVLLPDGRIRLEEVKGAFERQAERVRRLAAAAHYPIPLWFVTRDEDGCWHEEVLPR